MGVELRAGVGGGQMPTDERRDLSPDGLAFRELIDELLGTLDSDHAVLTEEGVTLLQTRVEWARDRFEDDRERVHRLNQILSVLTLLEGNSEWAEARRLILDVVRRQRR